MKKKISILFLLLASLCAVLMGCSSSSGGKGSGKSNFPNKPITLIVPWAAGGSSDAAARAFAKEAKKIIGQPVTIVNKPGANGSVATTEESKAKGDGYTVMLSVNGLFTARPFLTDVNYSIDEFKAIASVNEEPVAIAVNADSPWESIDDLVASLKKSGKAISYGHSGTGSFNDLAQAEFYKEAGIKANSVPFDGGKPALTALLGGHVDTVTGNPFSLKPQQEAGKIRILGIFSPERSDLLPDVPTMKEQGYDINMSIWKFILVPANTPADKVEVLRDKFKQVAESNEFQDFLKKNSLPSISVYGDDITKKLTDEAQQNKSIIKGLGISLN